MHRYLFIRLILTLGIFSHSYTAMATKTEPSLTSLQNEVQAIKADLENIIFSTVSVTPIQPATSFEERLKVFIKRLNTAFERTTHPSNAMIYIGNLEEKVTESKAKEKEHEEKIKRLEETVKDLQERMLLLSNAITARK